MEITVVILQPVNRSCRSRTWASPGLKDTPKASGSPFCVYSASHSLMTLKENLYKESENAFSTFLVAVINTCCQVGLYLAACNRNLSTAV